MKDKLDPRLKTEDESEFGIEVKCFHELFQRFSVINYSGFFAQYRVPNQSPPA